MFVNFPKNLRKLFFWRLLENKVLSRNWLIFILLGILEFGSTIAWGISASYLTTAPFVRFIHRCSQMLSSPLFFLGLGALIITILLVWLLRIALTARFRKSETMRYLCSLSLITSKPAKLQSAIKAAGITTPVDYVDSADYLAFAYGFFSVRIVISSKVVELLDEVELTAVILHEQSHCLQKDPLRIFLVQTFFAAFAHLPIFKPMIDYFILTMEINADNYALKHLGEQDWSLAAALLKLLKIQPVSSSTFGDLSVGATTLLDGRIEHLLNSEWYPRFSVGKKELLSLLLYLSLALGTFTYSIQHLTTWFTCHSYTLL